MKIENFTSFTLQVCFGSFSIKLCACSRCLRAYTIVSLHSSLESVTFSLSSVLSACLPLFPQFLSLFLSFPFLSPSLCLYLFVSAGLSRPVNLSAVSEDRALRFCSLLPFPVFFFLSLLCAAETHTCTVPHIQTDTQKQTNSLSRSPSQVHPHAVSLSLTL